MLDIFTDDAFSLVPLTDAINKLKFVPGLIGSMNLFVESGVPATSIALEERDGILVLVAPTPRGGPGTTIDKGKRNLRSVVVPHFEIDDAIMAEEVQGVRQWGSETALESIMGQVTERVAVHSQSLEATQEFSRIGAVKGIVTYADNTTLNLFTLFGVSQETEINFDLDAASPAEGVLRKACGKVVRQIANILEGVPFTGVHAFVGDTFYDELIAHKEVRETFLNQTAAAELRRGYVDGGMSFGSFEFGGIRWQNYRGKVGATDFVAATKAHIFPVGVPNLFRTYFAPADYVETVNTLGRRLTAKQFPMPNDKGIELEVQMNTLNICTRPQALIPGKNT
jgi:hypothetical protein